MASGTTFNPNNVNLFDSSKMQKAGMGVVNQTATKNSTTNIDYTVTDDAILNGGSICLIKNAVWGDSVTLQVLNGGSVVAQPLTNWPVDPDVTSQIIPLSSSPNKVIAGLTIRLAYTSVGNTNDVLVSIGYNFDKILV